MEEELLAARAFEFIRDGMEAGAKDWPNQSLYQSLAVVCKKLITDYPGNHIFFLANETVLFAFLNNAELLSYHPPEAHGESLILTTVSGGLTRDPEHWRAYPNVDRSRGQILIVSGGDLLYQGHL
jgi:hypothetical protein